MVALIAAIASDEKGVIGKDGKLPWKLRSDLRRFREITLGHPVIMGWNAFAEIIDRLHRRLDGRTNIVLTHQHEAIVRKFGAKPVHSPETALAVASEEGCEPFIIGGAKVYERMFPLVRDIHLTVVYPPRGKKITGDAYFPDVDLRRWTEKDATGVGLFDAADQYFSSYSHYTL